VVAAQNGVLCHIQARSSERADLTLETRDMSKLIVQIIK